MSETTTTTTATTTTTPEPTLETAIYAYLSEESDLDVYAEELPQDCDYPAITYSVAYNPSDHTFDGVATQNARVQIDVFSTEHYEMTLICQDLRSLLDGYKGSVGKYFCFFYLDNVVPRPESFEDGSGNWLYQSSMDFLVRFVE